MSIRRCARASGIAVVILSVLVPLPAMSAEPGYCRANAVLTAEQANGLDIDDCDVEGALVEHEGAGIYVPEPGQWVAIVAVHDDGSELSFKVATKDDGTVEVTGGPEDASGQGDIGEGPVSEAPAKDRCTDARNEILDNKWFEPADYYVNIFETLPNNIGAITFRDAITTSASVVANGTNTCGISVNPTLTFNFKGGTERNSNINGAEKRCASEPDGVSVVDAGYLPSSTNGLACLRGPDRVFLDPTTETDIRINPNRPWTLTSIGCSNKIDLRGTLTHEFGHMAGLDHVAVDAGDSALTMSILRPPCEFERRFLGKGDITGLLRFYDD